MAEPNFGANIKQMRLASGKTVSEISKHLTALGYKASEKTIYSWEAGRSQPTPDAFLDMCVYYGVSDILAIFGYKKEESTAKSDELDETGKIFMSLPAHLRKEALRYMRFLAEQGDTDKITNTTTAQKGAIHYDVPIHDVG